MKKIGILTFFEADNYGALLQCYALRRYCMKLNNDVRVIDYRSKQMFTWKHRLKNIFVKTLQNKKFDMNRKNFFKVGNKNDYYDLLIIGSDQVWNPSIIKGDNFWLDPKIKYNRLISYAASLGKSKLDEEEKIFFSNNDFSKYNLITVREKSGHDVLKKLGINSEIVCDPTLLFYDEPNAYDEIVNQSKVVENDYVYVYSLEKSKDIDEISNIIANKYGYKIVSSHPGNDKTQKCDEFVQDTDICDFLCLIKNAKIVVTNSFHGLAFSYIFRKEVYCVTHTKLGSRQTDLINTSGVKYEYDNHGQYHISNYENDEKMKEYIKKSKILLDEQI